MPDDSAAPWDPVGLQLGDADAPADQVAVCHEVTEAVVAAAEDLRPDLLITYHPLLFKPTNRLTAGRSPSGRAWRLARAGVAVAVAHTNFDVAPGGPSDALAGALGLTDTTGFAPLEGEDLMKIVTYVPPAHTGDLLDSATRAGAGTIGNYSACSFRVSGVGTFLPNDGSHPTSGVHGVLSEEPETRIEVAAPSARRDQILAALLSAHPYDRPVIDVYPVKSNFGALGRVGTTPVARLADLAALVARALPSTNIRVGAARPEVARVAVIPGSGASFAMSALAAGADVLVTGDVDHHRAVAAIDAGLSVIDAGHAATERPGVGRLADWVAACSASVVDLTKLDPTPWKEP